MLVEVDGAWAPGVGDPPSSCAGYADDPDLSGEESGMYWITAAGETVMAYCDMENDGSGWTLVATIGSAPALIHLDLFGEMSDAWAPGGTTNRLHDQYTSILGSSVRVGRMVGEGSSIGNIFEINDCDSDDDAACLWSHRISQNDGDQFGNWIIQGGSWESDPGGCSNDHCPTSDRNDRDNQPEFRIATFGGDCHSSCNNRVHNGFHYADYSSDQNNPSNMGERSWWSEGTVTPGQTDLVDGSRTPGGECLTRGICSGELFCDVWIR